MLTPLVIAGRIKLRPVYDPGIRDFSCTAKIAAAEDYAQLSPSNQGRSVYALYITMAPFGAGNILCIKWLSVGDILNWRFNIKL